MKTPIQAVLLDLDGTLLDTLPDIAAAANRLRAAYHHPHLPIEQIQTYVGKGVENLVHKVLTASETEQVDSVLHQQAVEKYMQYYSEENGLSAEFFPKVQAGLLALQALGMPMAVVTNKPYAFTSVLLEKMGIAGFFQSVIGGDTCVHKKPHPEPLLTACQQLGVQPEHSLMIGDSLNDIAAAKAAGCWSLVLPYGYSEGLDVQTFGANDIVGDIVAAAQWIQVTNSH